MSVTLHFIKFNKKKPERCNPRPANPWRLSPSAWSKHEVVCSFSNCRSIRHALKRYIGRILGHGFRGILRYRLGWSREWLRSRCRFRMRVRNRVRNRVRVRGDPFRLWYFRRRNIGFRRLGRWILRLILRHSTDSYAALLCDAANLH